MIGLQRVVKTKSIVFWLFLVFAAVRPARNRPTEVECMYHNGLTGEISQESYEHKICKTGVEACIQLTILPTKFEGERRFYGCVKYSDFGDVYNSSSTEKWIPRQAVKIGNKQYVGQLLVCDNENMCNEEISVSLEGIYEAKPMGYDEDENVLQVLIFTIVAILFIYPLLFFVHYFFMLKRRRICGRTEIGRKIVPLPDYDDLLYQNQETPDRLVEDGKIPTLEEFQNIFDTMHQKGTRERVACATTTDQRQQDTTSVRVYASSKMYKASVDMVMKISRTVSTRFENILYEILAFGPTILRLKPHNLASLFADLYEVLFHEPALIELPRAEECIIIGDLRGEYRDLHRWLRICGYPPTKKLIVLGGMIMHENLFSLETFVFLAALKISMPYDVYLLRGAPESLEFSLGQVQSWNISNAITTVVSNICERLPLAVIIGGKIFCVHSGISPLIKSLNDIEKIDRSKERLAPGRLLSHLIFSEPSPTVQYYKRMRDGRGLYFGAKAVKKFCHDHGISLIIRAHNCLSQGFFLAAEGKLLSLWSTPGYDECEHSAAALVHADMSVEIMQMNCD